jgi:hypothetical protein
MHRPGVMVRIPCGKDTTLALERLGYIPYLDEYVNASLFLGLVAAALAKHNPMLDKIIPLLSQKHVIKSVEPLALI